jgi:uncharacterized protein
MSRDSRIQHDSIRDHDESSVQTPPALFLDMSKSRGSSSVELADVELRVLDSLQDVEAKQWNALVGTDPFLRYEFLHALHESGCATPKTGWTPCYPTAWRGNVLVGAMPLYLKAHSFGEYVFDWSWADAYARHGYPYYPKLVSAIPFTPVLGARLLAETDSVRCKLVEAALALLDSRQISSLHCLFPRSADLRLLESYGLMSRSGVQFHWENRSYTDFQAFLASMSHDKRKKINQERRKLGEQKVTFRAISGKDASDQERHFFYRCYLSTYHAHNSSPYLNFDFFDRIWDTIPDHVILFLAYSGDEPIAASLCLKGGDRLFGRYWGSARYVPGLHFEMCYYQPIEFCVANGLRVFEGGAQGEHKLARGLMPVHTYSAHYVADGRFAEAIRDVLRREARGIEHYVSELELRTPFSERILG